MKRTNLSKTNCISYYENHTPDKDKRSNGRRKNLRSSTTSLKKSNRDVNYPKLMPCTPKLSLNSSKEDSTKKTYKTSKKVVETLRKDNSQISSMEIKRNDSMDMNTDTSRHLTNYNKTIIKLNKVRKNNEINFTGPYIYSAKIDKQSLTNSRRYNNLVSKNTLNPSSFYSEINDKQLNTSRDISKNFKLDKTFPKTDRNNSNNSSRANLSNNKDIVYNNHKEYFINGQVRTPATNGQIRKYDDKKLKRSSIINRRTKISLANTCFRKNLENFNVDKRQTFMNIDSPSPRTDSLQKVQNSFDNNKKVLGITSSLNRGSSTSTRLFSYNFEIVQKKGDSKTKKPNPFNSRNNSRNVSKTSIKNDNLKLPPNKNRFYNTTNNDKNRWKNNFNKIAMQNSMNNDKSAWQNSTNNIKNALKNNINNGKIDWKINPNVPVTAKIFSLGSKNKAIKDTIENRINKSIIVDHRGLANRLASKLCMKSKQKESLIEKLNKKVEKILFSGVESQMNNSIVSIKSKVDVRRNSIESIISTHNDNFKCHYIKRKDRMKQALENSIILDNEKNEISKKDSRQNCRLNFNTNVSFSKNVSPTVRKFNKPNPQDVPRKFSKVLMNTVSSRQKLKKSVSNVLKIVSPRNSTKSLANRSINKRQISNKSVTQNFINSRIDTENSVNRNQPQAEMYKNRTACTTSRSKKKIFSYTVSKFKSNSHSKKIGLNKEFASSNKLLKKKQQSTYLHEMKAERTKKQITFDKKKIEIGKSISKKEYQFDPKIQENSSFTYDFKYQKKLEVQNYFVDDLREAFIKPDANYFYTEFKTCFEDIFNTIKCSRGFAPANQKEIDDKKMPEIMFSAKEKVQFLDLDETLIHSQILQATHYKNGNIDMSYYTKSCDEQYAAYDDSVVRIHLRPGVREFLSEMVKVFIIVLFTSSIKEYADAVIQCFDPENQFFKYRFYRDHCQKSKNGKLIKDFSIFPNLHLKNCQLVDNSCAHYVNMINNGVPIINFVDNKDDGELLKQGRHLKAMHQSKRDFREYNSKYFKMDKQITADSISHGYDLVVT